MEQLRTVRDIIGLWPRRADLADDVAILMNRTVSADQVHKWAKSNSIPAKYQFYVLQAANLKGFKVSAERMLECHSSPNFVLAKARSGG